MSIGVHCEECGKTYQVRDEMAGRKGKCPKGHTIVVPSEGATSAAPAEENEFAFDTGSRFGDRTDSKSASRTARKTEKAEKAKPATPADEDDFAFSSSSSAADRDEEKPPKSNESRSSRVTGRDAGTGKKSMMPIIIGGVLAMVGIGGGITLFMLGRSEVNPLREEAAAARQRAEEADLNLKTAQAVGAAAEKNTADYKDAASKADAAAKQARNDLSAAEKEVKALKKLIKELEEAKPPMVKDPGGKKDPKTPTAKSKGPQGGKNWTSPPTFMYENTSHKAGDQISISPKEDAILKADGDQLRIKFRYVLQKGKPLPAEVFGTVFINQAGSVKGSAKQVRLSGAGGEAEFVVPVKGYTGSANITFALSDGNLEAGTRNLKIYSNFLAMQADFDKPKK